MPTRKWQSSSGASKNRILGATRLKSEGQTMFPVTLNDNSSNGFALNVQGSNLVLGLGTSEPFSRLSMGNNTDSGQFNANDTGRLASLAFNETSSGGKFSGMFYNSSIAKYNQTNDISSNGIQFKTTSLNNFDIYGSGGNLFITDENITTIGGFPRKGITELDNTDYKGIEKYIKPGNIFGADDPDNETLTNKEGQSKIVLDVRGSIRTDGYINFFNTTTTTVTEAGETSQIVESAPSAAWWSNADANIPRGSVWLQPTGAGRSEGMYYKNAAGTTLRIETIATTANQGQQTITKGDALKYNLFNFFFNATDQDSQSTVGIGNNDTVVAYPYAILKGGVSGARVQGDPASRVGGTALNIRGKNTNLSDIKHEKGFFVGTNEREIFSITEGNMSVTGLSGEEFLIKQKDAQTSGGPIHPMYSFPTEHGLLSTDASGGKVWIERQLLIGTNKSDLNWGLIDIQSTPNVPTLLSYNLDKDWNYDNETQRINRRYITEKATNAIILLNKSMNTTGDGDDGGSLVGSLYDCSNSIIIGDTFTSIDIPKSLIITVNPTLTTGDIDVDGVNGQQVFDDIGGSIVSGKNNWVYKSPYSLVIGKDNFIDNNQPGSYNATGLNSVLGDYNELRTGTTNFVAGSYHKVSGGGSNFVGGAVNHIGHAFPTTKERNANKSPSGSIGLQDYSWNTIFGYYNKIRNDISGASYSFAAGNANLVDVSRGVALGTHAYAGGDIRFAIGVNDTITTTTATSSSNSNKFVIDKDDNVGIGTSSPKHPLQIGDNNVNMTVQAASGMVINGTLNNSFESDYPSRNVANNGNAPILIVAAGTNASNNLSFGIGGSNYGFRTWIQGYFDNGIGGNGTKDILLQPVGGNVGIGTTSPASALQIDGPIFAMGTQKPTKGIHLGMNGNDAKINLSAISGSNYSTLEFSNTDDVDARGFIRYNHTTSTEHMQFFVNNTNEALRLMTNGDIYAPNNVGIGTSSPGAKLEVLHKFSTSSHTTLPIDSDNIGSNETVGLFLAKQPYNSTSFRYGLAMGTLTSGYSYLQSMSNDSNGRVLLLNPNGGNVGIGTDDEPEAKLHIYEDTNGSTANKTMLLIQSNPSDDCDAYDWNPLSIDFKMANQTDDYTNIARISAVMAPTGGDSHVTVAGEGNNALLFHTSKNTTLRERMRINHNGNVGIGTSSPVCKFNIAFNSTTTSNGTDLHTSAHIANRCYLGIGGGEFRDEHKKLIGFGYITTGSNYYPAYIGYQEKNTGSATYGDLIFGTRPNGTGSTEPSERMRIDSAGNVGIGTPSPEYALDVRGSGDQVINVYSTGGTNSAYARFSSNDGATTSPMLYVGTSTTECQFNSRWDYPMVFYQNNSEVMRIHDNGNVGIGETSPSSKLHIKSSSVDDGIKVRTHVGGADVCHLVSNSNGRGTLILKDSGNNTQVQLVGATVADNYIMGNVGIGTDEPGAKLHIHNASDNCEVKITHGNDSKYARLSIMGTNSQGTGDLYLGQSSQYGGGMIYQGDTTTGPALISNSYEDTITFYRRSNYINYPVFHYKYDRDHVWFKGRIGIGTHFGGSENPQAEIDVDGSILIRATTSSDTGGSPYYTGGRGIFFRPVYVPGGTGNLYNASITAHAHDGSHADGICIAGYDGISFRSGNHVGGGSYGAAQIGERMRIEPTGHVGIGTTNPTTQLHIKGGNRNYSTGATLYTDQLLKLQTARSSSSYLTWACSGNTGDDWDLQYSANGSTQYRLWLFYNDSQRFYTNGTPRMVIASGGNVGIGTISPSQKLHIIGSIMLSNNDTTSNYRNEGIHIVPFNDSSEQNGGGHIKFREDYDDEHGFSIGYNGGSDDDILNWKANTFNITRHNGGSGGVTGTPVITIPRSTGYVGIGTNNPKSALHVVGMRAAGAVPVSGIHLGGNTAGSTIDYAIELVAGASDRSCYIDFGYPGVDFRGRILYRNSDNYMSFYTAGSERLYITGSDIVFKNHLYLSGKNIKRSNHHTGHLEGSWNNVGDNDYKSNPIYTIGSNYNPSDAALGNMYGIGFTNGTKANFISGAASGWGLYVAADGDARTFLGGSTNGTSYINKNGGRLGIGTDNPGAHLEVSGQYGDNMLRLRDGVYYANFRMSSKFGSPGQLAGNYVNHTTGNSASNTVGQGRDFFIIETYANNEAAAIAMNGETTIIVNPGDYGALQWWDEDGYPSTSGSRWVISQTGGITSSSDIRLKENIDYLDNLFDISKVKQKFSEMKFCTYNLKKGKAIYDGRKTEYWGIIAQEVEVLFPELIETGSNEEKLKMINNERLTILSHHITKHLIKENSELKTEIETLKIQMSAILERLNAAGI